MNSGFLLLILLSSLLLGAGFAQAGDVSCQVDLLKSKINAAVIEEEDNKPAKLTVAEARLRLQKSQVAGNSEQTPERIDEGLNGGDNNGQETAQTNTETVADKTVKKTSRLGGIFDILLPSKLRNPVK